MTTITIQPTSMLVKYMLMMLILAELQSGCISNGSCPTTSYTSVSF